MRSNLRFYGNGGDDVIDVQATSMESEISGGEGNDTLTGGGGSSTVHGDAGDDQIDGGAGLMRFMAARATTP
jgi:Ca2+-binding RTX toxin-like protein